MLTSLKMQRKWKSAFYLASALSPFSPPQFYNLNTLKVGLFPFAVWMVKISRCRCQTLIGCLSITLELNKSLSAPVSSLPDGSVVCFLGIAAGTVCREELIHLPAAKTKYQRRDVL